MPCWSISTADVTVVMGPSCLFLVMICRKNPTLSQYKYSGESLRCCQLPLGPLGKRGQCLLFAYFGSVNERSILPPSSFLKTKTVFHFSWLVLWLFSGGGCIAVSGDGGLRQWQIVNEVNHVGHVPDSFWGIK